MVKIWWIFGINNVDVVLQGTVKINSINFKMFV